MTFIWTQKGYFVATSWRPVQMQKWNRSIPIHDFNRTLRIKQFEQALPNLQDTLRQMPLGSGLQLVAVSTPPVGCFVFKHGFSYLTSHIEVISKTNISKSELQSLLVDIQIEDRYWNKLGKDLTLDKN